MTLTSYFQHCDTTASSEFEKVLTESEKILFKSLKRIVIRGKRGRGVPVLLEHPIVESIEFSIPLREEMGLTENPYIFGIPGTTNPISGNLAMRKHAKLALGDSNKASLLTSTKLRKHLATIMQILKMDKTDLEQLASFMGHTEKTHAEFYRLPVDVYQTAKVSKLLLLSKSGSIERFKGKRLSEIVLDDTIVEDDESEGDNNDPEHDPLTVGDETPSNNPQIDMELTVKKGKKRTLVAWTEDQKKITEEFFKRHIKKKIPPKKHEVEMLVERNPGIFDNKSWQVIKVYVTNKYSKK